MSMDQPLPQSWWRTSRAWLTGAGVLATLVALFVIAQSFRPQRSVRLSTQSVTIASVERGIFRDFVPLRARVVPRDIVFLDAQEGGRVERVLVEAGDIVTAGQ